MLSNQTDLLFKNKNCILRNKLGSNKLEVFNAEDKRIEIDNAGDFSGDTVNIVGLLLITLLVQTNLLNYLQLLQIRVQ